MLHLRYWTAVLFVLLCHLCYGQPQSCFALQAVTGPSVSVDGNSHRISTNTNCSVIANDRAVSVSAIEVPVEQLLHEIGQRLEFTVTISPEFVSYRVTDQFDNLPLETAIQRLMQGSSYSLVYSGGATSEVVRELHILPSGSHSAHSAQTAKPDTPLGAEPELTIQSSQHDLLRAIEGVDLPDNVKVALRYEATAKTVGAERGESDRRQAMNILLEMLELKGLGGSEIAQQLKAKIAGESE